MVCISATGLHITTTAKTFPFLFFHNTQENRQKWLSKAIVEKF